MNVFLDSDVVVSALISTTGAAYKICEMVRKKQIKGYISNLSQIEIKKVGERLSISKIKIKEIASFYSVVKLTSSYADYALKYSSYVYDQNDGHIIAGALKAKARFLLTYNMNDFKKENIKRDFNILVMTPGTYLQYLRSS